MDLLSDLAISLMFNVANLIRFKGDISQQGTTPPKVLQDIDTNVMPKKKPAKVEKVLEYRVKKATMHKFYMEHLIKWKDQVKYKAT